MRDSKACCFSHPRPHPIVIRFSDDAGNVDPASGLGGLTYDPPGRTSANPNDYILPADLGDGSLLNDNTDARIGNPCPFPHRAPFARMTIFRSPL